MKRFKAACGILTLTLALLLATGCVPSEQTDQRPTPDAAANRMRTLESRLNRLEKDMEKVRSQQLEQRAGISPGASAGLELRVRELELRLNALTNAKHQEPAPAGISRANATAEQQALVTRMADCIRQSETNHEDEALRNAWRIAAGVTDTGQLRRVTDAVCQSDDDAR